MIKLADTTLLALTKLYSRKVRTIITVLLASLLFGVLIAASLVMTGAFRSVASFREDGLTSRYIVGVSNAISDPTLLHKLLRDPVLIKEAKSRYEALVAKKTIEAKRLGLTYTQASDQPPYTQAINGDETLSVNDSNGIIHDLLTKKFSGQPVFDDSKLRSITERYGATSFFESEYYMVKRGSSLSVLPSGGEKLYDQSDDTDVNTNRQTPILDSSAVISPSNITEPFMLPNKGRWKPSDNSIPIILPQNIIEQLLGLEILPDNASPSAKLSRLRVIRSKAESLSFQACYRNDVSQALIQRAIQQQKGNKAHSGEKDYRKPNLTYSLPDPKTCQEPIVKSDTRTITEKKTDENQVTFDKEFGKDTKPVSYFVSFKVVGVSPTEQFPQNQQQVPSARSMSDLLNSMLSTFGIGQTIPKALYDQIPDKTKYKDIFTYTPMYLFGNEDNKQRYVEFATAKDATKFIDEQSCTIQYDNTCKPLGHPYQAFVSFSNSVALDDIQYKTREWLRYAMLAVIVLAAVIMWITIGRAIADGRHETAVFRAIGFKRSDIAAVYILYTVMLSALVAILAIFIGWFGAFITNRQFAQPLTAEAQYSFSGLDMTKEVNLTGFDQEQLILILAACFATGLLSLIIPLVSNVRRSPIRDMREE